MNYQIIKKTLAVGVIFLFIGVVFQPAIADKSILSENKQETLDIEEAKEYLFETIIEIANNPDVKELLEQIGYNLFESEYDFKSVRQQLLFKKPSVFFSTLLTRPSLTTDYLNKAYNNGVEIIDVIGKEEALKIIDSIKFENPEIFNALSDIISNNLDLSEKIEQLDEMNKQYSPEIGYEDTPIICFILLWVGTYHFFTSILIIALGYIFEDYPIISNFFFALGNIKGAIGTTFIFIYFLILECEPYYP